MFESCWAHHSNLLVWLAHHDSSSSRARFRVASMFESCWAHHFVLSITPESQSSGLLAAVVVFVDVADSLRFQCISNRARFLTS